MRTAGETRKESPPELAFTEDVGDRLATFAPKDHRLEPLGYVIRDGLITMREIGRAILPQRVPRRDLGVDRSLVRRNTRTAQALAGLDHALQHRHAIGASHVIRHSSFVDRPYRWPPKTAPGEQMQVTMEHRLAGFRVAVEHRPVARSA